MIQMKETSTWRQLQTMPRRKGWKGADQEIIKLCYLFVWFL